MVSDFAISKCCASVQFWANGEECHFLAFEGPLEGKNR